MTSIISHLLAAMAGGTIGLLAAALAAASKRAEWLEDQLDVYEVNEEHADAIFIATDQEFESETLNALVEELQERLGARVIILDGYFEQETEDDE